MELSLFSEKAGNAKNYILWLLWHMRDPKEEFLRTRMLEQGNRVKVPDTERICFDEKERSGLPKVAVFRKYCFHAGANLACGENRSLDGLSWPGEKAEAMRWQ